MFSFHNFFSLLPVLICRDKSSPKCWPIGLTLLLVLYLHVLTHWNKTRRNSIPVCQNICWLDVRLSKDTKWYVWSTAKATKTQQGRRARVSTRHKKTHVNMVQVNPSPCKSSTFCVSARFLCNDTDACVTMEVHTYAGPAYLMIAFVTSMAHTRGRTDKRQPGLKCCSSYH